VRFGSLLRKLSEPGACKKHINTRRCARRINSMIFMSQSGITGHARERDWDEWYFEHLRIMATVPGVFSAQRFKTNTPGYAPSLAMYGVVSADVFKGEYYLSVRGMGEWLPLIDRRWYQRNLFDGLECAPQVGDDQSLLVADRAAVDSTLATLRLTWLAVAGIDCSTPYRGIAVTDAAVTDTLPDNVAIYRPASKRYVNFNTNKGNPV
jgi:hypothetical protein